MKQLPTSLALSLLAALLPLGAEPADKPLKIVFLLGQSNMVGLANIDTAWYLTQPQFKPPREMLLKRSPTYDWTDLYWEGRANFDGPPEKGAELNRLWDERGELRKLWRKRVKGAEGPWKEEWGEKPPENSKRSVMDKFFDQKAVEAGIYKKIAAIIDESKFTPEMAYEQIVEGDERNAEDIARVRGLYLKDTKPEDFATFTQAVKDAKIKVPAIYDIEETRNQYASLAQEHLNLPVASRTWISTYGAMSGSKSPPDAGEIDRESGGPLSIGYGAHTMQIGPEYGVGIALENELDGPILLVKCAWGNTTVANSWRPGSLSSSETPTEKAQREAFNAAETEAAKAEGREPKLRAAPDSKGKPGWCWEKALPHIRKVLANPGDYHPQYNPEKGSEIAGMVWFQGYSDMGNKAYGEQLTEMIKWFRKEIDAPELPVVLGSLGVSTVRHTELTGNVSGGMVYASQQPELEGKVTVVNTGRYYPKELAAIQNLLYVTPKDDPKRKPFEEIAAKASSNKGFHYMGSAKFFILAGDAMGRAMAELVEGDGKKGKD